MPFDANLIAAIVDEARSHSVELPWIEFKVNYYDPQAIGEYVSSLSNTAALFSQPHGFLIWGVNDESHEVIGTGFDPDTAKAGNQGLSLWIATQLEPQVQFYFHKTEIDGKRVVLLEITAAYASPVKFRGTDYIRIDTSNKKLKDFPDTERELWAILSKRPFESLIAMENVSEDFILRVLDYPAYFDMLSLELPSGRKRIIERLLQDRMITKNDAGAYSITNLGAILFARRIRDFPSLERKAIRVIVSRNESLASFMRRVGVCEERGSGYDKVVAQTEFYQLPAPEIEIYDNHTKVILYAYQTFGDMTKDDRVRACYLHACLKRVNREYMTNSSLRERFAIPAKNRSMISRLLTETCAIGLIKVSEDSTADKNRRYLPYWA